jgi:hypothetical protein
VHGVAGPLAHAATTPHVRRRPGPGRIGWPHPPSGWLPGRPRAFRELTYPAHPQGRRQLGTRHTAVGPVHNPAKPPRPYANHTGVPRTKRPNGLFP